MHKWLVPIALVLAGCNDETPPRWKDVCVEWTTEMRLVPIPGVGIPIGKMSLMPTQVCTKKERRCIAGKDYRGKVGCE